MRASDLRFTIAIPASNRLDYFRTALASCFAQTHERFEIRIGDDSTGEEIGSYVESLGRTGVHYSRNRPPQGVARNLNHLLAEARGHWMVVLGDDDVLEPAYLATLARLIEGDPEASLIRVRYRLIDPDGRPVGLDRKESFRMEPPELLERLFLPADRVPVSNISGVAFPTEALRAVGGFRDLCRGWNTDRVAWAELGARGPSYFVPEPLVSLRVHPTSLSRSPVKDLPIELASDEKVREIVEGVLDGLERKAAPGDRAALRRARGTFRRFLRADRWLHFDRHLVQVLGSRKTFVWEELSRSPRELRRTGNRLYLSGLGLLAIGLLPYPLRNGVLHPYLGLRETAWRALDLGRSLPERRRRLGYGLMMLSARAGRAATHARFWRRRRVLVYTPGRVGSSAVIGSLRRAPLPCHLHHVHYLDPDRIEKYKRNLREDVGFVAGGARELVEGSHLRRRMARERVEADWKIVTLVRDPVATCVSGHFFRKHARGGPVPEASEEAVREGVRELREVFAHAYNYEWILHWLDDELAKVFGIDVHATPFPHERGYAIHRGPHPDLLVIRLEDLERVGEVALRQFLGLDRVRIGRENSARERAYGALYARVVRSLELDAELLERIYRSRFARHFYRPDELERFARRWGPKTGTAPRSGAARRR